jgi:ABC-type transport system involved in multi-copper enzyme maturation permease subunit
LLLGAVFVAIGYLVSALVRDHGTAAGISIVLSLLLVLVYEMGCLACSRSTRAVTSRRPRSMRCFCSTQRMCTDCSI